jgi:hypothetical protein
MSPIAYHSTIELHFAEKGSLFLDWHTQRRAERRLLPSTRQEPPSKHHIEWRCLLRL